MALRVPPQNLDAEKAVIGAILIDNEVIPRIIDVLRPNDFYDPRHEVIYTSIMDLISINSPIDVLTLTTDLKKRNKVRESGGAEYLAELVTIVPTSGNVEEYAKIVKETSLRRQIITKASKFDEIARDEQTDIEDVFNTIEKDIFALNSNSAEADFLDAGTLIEQQMARADEYAKNPDAIRGLPTGLRSLDEILGGLHKSDLIILAARPSVGKSALSFDIAREIAVSQKKSIVIFSLEMPGIQVIERMLAQQTRIPLWDLRMGKLNDDDFIRVNEGADKITRSKIFVNETPGINIVQLRSKARKLKMEHGLDLIVIDYLQLMQGTQKSSESNRAQEVGEISRSLKILARELNIPVIALSQLNRSVETRNDRIPQLSDLRESGSIEQDADLVMFLSRDLTEEENKEQQHDFIKVDLIVAKHRNGPIGRINLKYQGRFTKFTDWEE